MENNKSRYDMKREVEQLLDLECDANLEVIHLQEQLSVTMARIISYRERIANLRITLHKLENGGR